MPTTPVNAYPNYTNISDTDKNNLLEQYGYDFFEKTRPILIIHNDTMNYSFEVEINDFANSWYLHVNDSNCNYRIDYEKPIRVGTEEHDKLPTIAKVIVTDKELTDEEKVVAYDNIIKSLM